MQPRDETDTRAVQAAACHMLGMLATRDDESVHQGIVHAGVMEMLWPLLESSDDLLLRNALVDLPVRVIRLAGDNV